MSGGLEPIPNPISQPYWDGTSERELHLRECHACGARFRFIRELCPKCWSTDLGIFRSSGQGRIAARVIVHTAPYPAMAERVPYVLALVELEEGVTMMSNIVECDPNLVEVGQRVTLTWEERGDFVLPQFRPA